MDTIAIAGALIVAVGLTAVVVWRIEHLLHTDEITDLCAALADARKYQRAADIEIQTRGALIADQRATIVVLRREASQRRYANLLHFATEARAGIDEATVASEMSRFDTEAAELFRRPTKED